MRCQGQPASSRLPVRTERPKEVANPVDCLLPLREERRESLPNMKHLGPYLECHVHTRGPGFAGKTGAIIAKYLGIARLD